MFLFCLGHCWLVAFCTYASELHVKKAFIANTSNIVMQKYLRCNIVILFLVGVKPLSFGSKAHAVTINLSKSLNLLSFLKKLRSNNCFSDGLAQSSPKTGGCSSSPFHLRRLSLFCPTSIPTSGIWTKDGDANCKS